MRRSLTAAAFSFALLALAAAPSVLADSRDSVNWSGYAVHRPGVKFTRVSGSWVQPSASCVPGVRAYSAFWVGIGGYSLTSNSLEQIGTEVDCSASGAVRSTAWYELVPAGSRNIPLRVRPGDQMSAAVTVIGHRVSVVLIDHTSGRSFHRILHARTVDVSSAEWIAEAPSSCFSDSSCQTLPLADFGSAVFSRAWARSTSDRVGSISSPAWRWTRLRLLPSGRRFIVEGGGGAGGEATASAFSADGSQFTVNYSQPSSVRLSMRARAASARGGSIVR